MSHSPLLDAVRTNDGTGSTLQTYWKNAMILPPRRIPKERKKEVIEILRALGIPDENLKILATRHKVMGMLADKIDVLRQFQRGVSPVWQQNVDDSDTRAIWETKGLLEDFVFSETSQEEGKRTPGKLAPAGWELAKTRACFLTLAFFFGFVYSLFKGMYSWVRYTAIMIHIVLGLVACFTVFALSGYEWIMSSDGECYSIEEVHSGTFIVVALLEFCLLLVEILLSTLLIS